jgi:hypothetical protein
MFFFAFPAPGMWGRNWRRDMLLGPKRCWACQRRWLLMSRRCERLWRLKRRQMWSRRLSRGNGGCRMLKKTARLRLCSDRRMLVGSGDRLRMVDRFSSINPLLNGHPLVLAGRADTAAPGPGRLEFCSQCQLNLVFTVWTVCVEIVSLSHDSGPLFFIDCADFRVSCGCSLSR